MATRTKFASKQEFAKRVADAVRAVAPAAGYPPTPTDAFVTAHAALSSGWGRAVWEWNITGIKAGKDYRGRTWTSPTTEIVDGEPRRVQAAWRAYDDATGWARDYFAILEKRRYHLSRDLLRRGSLEFMAQLGRDGWYTAEPDEVSQNWQSVLRRVNRYLTGSDGGAVATEVAVLWLLIAVALVGVVVYG